MKASATRVVVILLLAENDEKKATNCPVFSFFSLFSVGDVEPQSNFRTMNFLFYVEIYYILCC